VRNRFDEQQWLHCWTVSAGTDAKHRVLAKYLDASIPNVRSARERATIGNFSFD
jgi:hypothetical protein